VPTLVVIIDKLGLRLTPTQYA